MIDNLMDELSSKGYWPAIAAEYFERGRYSNAVGLCLERLKDSPGLISGRIILARAYYHAGQIEDAEEQFYLVLRDDPDNMNALKYLGDIRFSQGDEITAFAFYERVLDIDPHTDGLCADLKRKEKEIRKLSIKRADQITGVTVRSRSLPILTETAGDLLLAQGHPRMALDVFLRLREMENSPRLIEKIESVQDSLKKREKT
jgi:tetratricopeptide (TPR) repeat protein